MVIFLKRLIISIFIFIFGLPLVAISANHYIIEGGSGDGSAWNNALDDLPTPLIRGDTYYIGDGTYAGYTFDDAVSGTDIITVKKSTVADHGTETGYVSTDHDGQAIFDGNMYFQTSYHTLDGVVGGGVGSWTSGYGFYVDQTGETDTGSCLSISAGVTNIIAKHIELEGHGDDAANYTQDGVYTGAGDGPHTFSYLYIHDMGRTIIYSRSHNTTWEYLYTGKFESTSAQHAQIASMWINITKGVDAVENTVFRYSVFTWAEGTGGLTGEWDGADIYGNIFVNLSGSEFSSSSNGLIGGWTDRIWKNVRIYNNTFINCGVWAIVRPGIVTVQGDAGNIAKNNLFINTPVEYGTPAIVTYDYNEYIATTPDPNDEANGSISSVWPYTDYENLDFTMTRATETGDATIGATYNTDMYGETRGQGTTWDRGAIEYIGGAAASGTIIPGGCTESEIVSGGRTIVVTLSGDEWVADGATFEAQRQNIINGVDSGGEEAGGWDAVVKAELAVTAVVRTNATTVTITLPDFDDDPNTAYAITANETVTVTIPATAVVGAVEIVATPTFQISAELAAPENLSIVYDATGLAMVYDANGIAITN